MIKELYVSNGIDSIINQFKTKMLTGAFVVKAVGLSELALLVESKRHFPKNVYFHVSISTDSDTLARARPYLDDLCSEVDIHPITLNCQIGISTNYAYLTQIIKEGGFRKIELSHSDKEPDNRKLAEFIIEIRDLVLLDWSQYNFGDVASAVAEHERWQFESEARRVEALKGTEYRRYIVSWFNKMNQNIRTMQARINELEGKILEGGK